MEKSSSPDADADSFAELRAGAHGAGFNGLVLNAIARTGRTDGEKSNEHQTANQPSKT